MILSGSANGRGDNHFNLLLVEYDTEQSALEQEAAELKEGITAQAEDGMFVPPRPKAILTAEEEAKAQKALAAWNREREQNKLRMRRVREAQRIAKEAGKLHFRWIDLAALSATCASDGAALM